MNKWTSLSHAGTILFISWIMICPLPAQTSWEKFTGNPVISRGILGEFDWEQAKQPSVIFDSGIYKMWYVGRSSSHEQIGYAESQDGVHWIKKGPVLPFGSDNEFDAIHQNTPDVLKIGSIYYMWYGGFNGSYWSIGKAASTDGMNWDKQGVVLTPGSIGDFDAFHILSPSVLLINSTYLMWYEAFDGRTWRIGFATSTDGLYWNKKGIALDIGSAYDFDSASVGHPEVFFVDNIFHLWYWGFDGIHGRTGYAMSIDGTVWSKQGVALDIGAQGFFDSGNIGDVSIIRNADRHELWYSGAINQDWQIGYAVEDTTYNKIFSDVTSEVGLAGPWDAGCAFGDINNDGYQDLYLGYRYGLNALFLNHSGEEFSNIASYAKVDYSGLTLGVSWADFNNDGFLDLYACNHNSPNILYKNKGDAFFQNIATTAGVGTTLGSYHAVWGDYNNDGFVDLYVVNFGYGQPNILYKNNGNETFSDVTQQSGVDGHPTEQSRNAMWGDYNNDGWLDLFVVNQGKDVLYRNMGDGTFVDVTMQAGVFDTGNGFSCLWTDYNNDGALDLCVSNTSSSLVLFKNTGNGTFVDVTFVAGLNKLQNVIGSFWGDFDNDGNLDLYVANPYGIHNYLFFNDGQGNFIDKYSSSGLFTANTTWACLGDYNNDGFLDILVTALTGKGTARLFRNNGITNNHWLVLTLIGSISNRSAIGAKVKLIAGSEVQFREVNGGCGNYSFDSLPVEFGLGKITSVDSVIITWPSGIIQVLANLPADQILTVFEKSSKVEIGKEHSIPENFLLSQNFPNPFNCKTIISYQLPLNMNIELVINNLFGQRIRTVANGFHNAGYYQIAWDGRDDENNQVTSGIYIYQLNAGEFILIKKMLMLK